MSALSPVFDDALLQCPIGQVLILSFLFGFNDVSGEVATNVFHAIIPAALTFEDSAAEAASATLGRLTLLDPASLPNRFKTVLEGLPVGTRLLARSEGARAGSRLGLVHATMMLGEKILAVEVVVDTLVARDTRVEFGVARTNIAAIEA